MSSRQAQKWDGYRDWFYYEYIVRRRTLRDIHQEFQNLNGGLKVGLRTLQTQINRWEFPSKRNPLWENEEFIAKVQSLYQRNYTTPRMIRALHIDGYTEITDRALKEFRLHPSIRLLLGAANDRKAEADAVADEIIRSQIDSGQALNYGATYMQASIRLQNIFVSERRIREAIKRVDPVGAESRKAGLTRKRGQFRIKGPNRVWSIDGHDKLSPFGFEIYGGIDCYSRYLIWIYVGDSNRTAISVYKQYLTALLDLKRMPKVIRADMGYETLLVAGAQIAFRRNNKPDLPFRRAFQFGPSTKNQRIESFWNLLANGLTDVYRNIFAAYERRGIFETANSLDKISLKFIYMKMLRKHVQGFMDMHNIHKIRRQRRRAHYLPTGVPDDLFHYPESGMDFGTEPNWELHTNMQAQVFNYDLNKYLPDETMQLCKKILEEQGLPTEYDSLNTGHEQAYRCLREELRAYVEETGMEVRELEKPTDPERWLRENEPTEEVLKYIEEELKRKREEVELEETEGEENDSEIENANEFDADDTNEMVDWSEDELDGIVHYIEENPMDILNIDQHWGGLY